MAAEVAQRPKPQTSPERFEGESCLNGLAVPDWLIEPLYQWALACLEVLDRKEVPPKLVPLLGRRVRKPTPSQRAEILGALGRHDRYTGAVLAVYRDAHRDLEKNYKRLSPEQLADECDHLQLSPEQVVSVLIAAGRSDDAQRVADLLYSDEDEDELDDGAALTLEYAKQAGAARRELEEANKLLKKEQRARRRLQRKLDQAVESSHKLRGRLKEAEARAVSAEASAKEQATTAQRLEAELAERAEQTEDYRRKARDLKGELDDLQRRFSRTRRSLRETRAKLPAEPARPKPTGKARPAPPSLTSLRAALGDGGAKAVLDTKRLRVIVDGWNVALGQMTTPKLEHKRRLLEDALEAYRARTKNEVLVVYDGRKVSWFYVPRAARRTIERAFTVGESADDYIVAEVEDRPEDVTPVVVTSDRELASRCLARGAFVLSSPSFAQALRL